MWRVALLLLALSSCAAEVEPVHKEATLTGAPPVIIAHRGASGHIIEHTLEAYQRGLDYGADYIEPDLVQTKDGVLVARHENEISGTTNVADHLEFADRKTTKTVDGKEHTGWFTEDFTLAELKTLRTKERLPQLRPGNTPYDGQFEIPTFEEILKLLKTHEEKTGQRVGIYPETKHPSYFMSLGLPHNQSMLALLAKYGFEDADDPVFIQSFEITNLRILRWNTKIRLVQLVADEGGPADAIALQYAEMITPAGLREIAKYADGIGPSKNMVIGRDALGRLDASTGLVAAAHKAGLLVHPWTFRRENYFLPTEYKSSLNPTEYGNLKEEVARFIAEGVDGLFSDNPGIARDALKD